MCTIQAIICALSDIKLSFGQPVIQNVVECEQLKITKLSVKIESINHINLINNFKEIFIYNSLVQTRFGKNESL